MRDLETKRANATQEEMKLSFSREIAALAKTINNIEYKINNTLAAYDQRITLGQAKINNFDAMISEMQQFTKENYDKNIKNLQQIDKLQRLKVDQKSFEEIKNDIIK